MKVFLTVAVFIVTLATAPYANAICGRRDGCGNPAMDFRVRTPTYSEPIAPAPPSPAEIAAQRTIALNNTGLQQHQRGNYQEAIRLFQQALQTAAPGQNTTNTRINLGRAYHMVGIAAFNSRNYAEAVRQLEQAAANNPNEKVTRDSLVLARKLLAEEVQARNYALAMEEAKRRIGPLTDFVGGPPPGSPIDPGKLPFDFLAGGPPPVGPGPTNSTKAVAMQRQATPATASSAAELEALRLQIRLEAQRLAATPGTQTRFASASAQADAIKKDGLEKPGCVFDGQTGCSPGTSLAVPKIETGLRGAATLSAKVLQAMRNTPALSKLLDEEVRAEAAWSKALDNVREKELALVNARPEEKSQRMMDVSKAVQDERTAKSASDTIKVNIEQAAKVIDVVELVPDNKQPPSAPPPPTPPR